MQWQKARNLLQLDDGTKKPLLLQLPLTFTSCSNVQNLISACLKLSPFIDIIRAAVTAYTGWILVRACAVVLCGRFSEQWQGSGQRMSGESRYCTTTHIILILARQYCQLSSAFDSYWVVCVCVCVPQVLLCNLAVIYKPYTQRLSNVKIITLFSPIQILIWLLTHFGSPFLM